MRYRLAFAFAAAAAALAGPAQAQDSNALIACGGIPDQTERLACYDRATAASSKEGRAVTERRAAEEQRINREKAAAASAAAAAAAEADKAKRRAEFGGAAIGKGHVDSAAIGSIHAKLTDIYLNQSKLALFVLDNGQMWRQNETYALPRIRIGDDVTIRTAVLGGFVLSKSGDARVVAVKRVK